MVDVELPLAIEEVRDDRLSPQFRGQVPLIEAVLSDEKLEQVDAVGVF